MIFYPAPFRERHILQLIDFQIYGRITIMKLNTKNVLAGVGGLSIILVIISVGVLGNADGGIGGLAFQALDSQSNNQLSSSSLQGELKILNPSSKQTDSTPSVCGHTNLGHEVGNAFASNIAFNSREDMYFITLNPQYDKYRIHELTPGQGIWIPFRRTGFINPLGITIDREDNVYIADAGDNSIRMFDKQHTLLKTWSEKDLQKPYAPFSPSVMSTFKDPNDGKEYIVFVNTTNPNSLFKFEANNVNATIQYFADYKGDIQGITADSSNVYISDHGRNKIVKFNANGKKILEAGESGNGDGQFNDIYGVAVDVTYIYIADKGNHRIHIFTKSDFKYYSSFEGNYPLHSGPNDLKNSTALAIAPSGLLYISDVVDGSIWSFGLSDCARIITIKDFVPGFNPLDFRFTLNEGKTGLGGIYPNPNYRVAFTLADNANSSPSSKKTLSVSAENTYVIEELKDYKDINISYSCTYSSSNRTSNGAGGIVGVDPKFNETVTCTFANKKCPVGQICADAPTDPSIKKN